MKKTKITVNTQFGTFTRTTARTYTHIIVGRSLGRYKYLTNDKGQEEYTFVPEIGPIVDLTWVGRPDLATKAANKYRSELYAKHYGDVAIIDIATGEKVSILGVR